jgi:argininosuccinate lyase
MGKDMDADFAVYSSSLEFDRNLFEYDILGSAAHVVMLGELDIIGQDESAAILKGLGEIYSKGISGLDPDPSMEDIHMAIEGRLKELVGDAAGWMHTARSRNDQVACDLRMWLRDEIDHTILLLLKLCGTLAARAKENTDTIMPGYTHLQHAQPTTLAHNFVGHLNALLRDAERLQDTYKRVNQNPLGSGALATTGFKINRKRTTELLAFDGVLDNSQDGVASRDFMTETLFDLVSIMVNMSRLAEELIIWSTTEFAFVELDDAFASTSSIMPQKKNPDSMELLRGKTSRVIGNLVSALTLSKALPFSYNRDLQEMSPLAADSLGVVKGSLVILEGVIRTLKVNKERMAEMAGKGFSTATDLADYLVQEKGIPFRVAHKVVGRTVALAMEEGSQDQMGEILSETFKEVTGQDLGISPDTVMEVLDPKSSVKARDRRGGPAPEAMKRSLANAHKAMKDLEGAAQVRIKKVESSKKALVSLMGGQ